MANKKIILFLLVFQFSSLCFSEKKQLLAAEKKSKAYFQKEFLRFAHSLFNWASYARKLAVSDPLSEIYFRLSKQKLKDFGIFLEKNREVLYALHKYDDLHIYNKVEIIPSKIYIFIADNFGLTRSKSKIDRNALLVKLIGGSFKFRKKKKIVIHGLLELMENYDISTWKPVRLFINSFKDTMTVDVKLANKVGRTILPILENYYTFMDVLSRLNLFKSLLKEAYEALKTKEQRVDLDRLVVRVFQSSGPLLIKMLQELQEEIVGETPITKILSELKNCRPMSFKKVKEIVKIRIKELIKSKKQRKHIIKEKPLGIASIAQTHLMKINGLRYVVKIQKEGISKLFYRELDFVQKILRSNETFDKGMKQWIFNISKGIEEELDFSVERKHIQKGFELYIDRDSKINSVSLPSFTKSKVESSSKKVLFMSVAKGKSVGSIMEQNIPEKILPLYIAIQRLYEKYLQVALSDKINYNFYHGDLHRENIFYDSKSDILTLIDFGNGGKLSPFVKASLLNIYKLVKKTNTDDEALQDKFILKLGGVLEKFILRENAKNSLKIDPLQENLVKTYFKQCFNPTTSIYDKIYENKRLQERRVELFEDITRLEAKIEMSGPKKDDLILLKSKRNNMDFIKALMNNCLNGPINYLVTSLTSKNSVSNKLQSIFQELQKNGIAMSKEAIFFNKSNGLLQGILTNLAQMLEESNIDFEPVNPDDIFSSVMWTNAMEDGI